MYVNHAANFMVRGSLCPGWAASSPAGFAQSLG